MSPKRPAIRWDGLANQTIARTADVLHARYVTTKGWTIAILLYKGVHPVFFAGTGCTLFSHSTAMAGVTLFLGLELDRILYVRTA